MRYEALFREHRELFGSKPDAGERAVARARRAETLLGLCLDDWWEADPRPELPEALRPDGPRKRGKAGKALRGFREYTNFREELEDRMDGPRWSIGFTAGRLGKGLAASAGALEAGLRLEDGDPGAPMGLLGQGRDGAAVVAHVVAGDAGRKDLDRLAGVVAMVEAGVLEGVGYNDSTAVRGYLAAAGFEEGVLDLVGRTPGVEARVYKPTMAFKDAPWRKGARWSRTRRRP